MILYDNDVNGIELSDGPSVMPGSVRISIHEDELHLAEVLIGEREAREIADALLRGKLQALLDALDAHPRPALDLTVGILRAREALR